MSISEITGLESDTIMLQDLFVFKRTGKDEAGKVLGQLVSTGLRPRVAEQLQAAGIDLKPLRMAGE